MTRITKTLLAFALLATVACAAKTEAEAPAFVNTNCPIMGNEVEADAGRYLLGWVQEAGFTEVTMTASTWVYATPEQRALFEDWVLTARFHDYPEGWLSVFEEASYTGDYDWTILE